MVPALSSNPTSIACEAQRLIKTSFKVASSSGILNLDRSPLGKVESIKFVLREEKKMDFSLHCMVALNLHNKCVPERFADEICKLEKYGKGGKKA